MRVLLDESMPRRFGELLAGHAARTVQQMGWTRTRDGELLRRLPDAGIDVLVTIDRSIPFQQRIAEAKVGVIVLVAPTNRLVDVAPLAPGVMLALEQIRPGQVIYVPDEPPPRRRARR